MRYRVLHKTEYEYAEPVSICHSTAHLQPRDTPTQSCAISVVTVEPQPDTTTGSKDYFGNDVMHFAVQRSHRKLAVTSSSVVEIRCDRLAVQSPGPTWEMVRDALSGPARHEHVEATQFLYPSLMVRLSAEMRAYALESFTFNRPMLAACADLTRRIFRDFKYDKEATNVATPIEQVWAKKRGVCQDFAHVQIACLRSLGLPARYVSGYLLTKPPPGKERLIGADASHAWVSVYCIQSGWVDFDPTNDVVPWDRHITLAWGRDFGDVSPIRGVILGGGQHTVAVAVDVEPQMAE